jgi:hypothetical protein
MSYPKFYKRGNKYTCIKNANEFIQVNTIAEIGVLTYGSNLYYTKDSIRYDVEITSKEFEDAVLLHISNLTKLTEEIENLIAKKN